MANQVAWQRAWYREYTISGFTEVDVPKLLAQQGMAPSVREATRMCEANQIWYDDELSLNEWSTRRERFTRIGRRLHEGRFWVVEPGDCIGVGKNVDEAMCHRIEMVEVQ